MSLGIIPVTSPQPRGIIIPIVSENLPFQGEKEGIDNAFGSELQALAMTFAQKKGIGNAFRSKESMSSVFGSKWQPFAMIFAQKEGIANAFT